MILSLLIIIQFRLYVKLCNRYNRETSILVLDLGVVCILLYKHSSFTIHFMNEQKVSLKFLFFIYLT